MGVQRLTQCPTYHKCSENVSGCDGVGGDGVGGDDGNDGGDDDGEKSPVELRYLRPCLLPLKPRAVNVGILIRGKVPRQSNALWASVSSSVTELMGSS